MEQTAREDSFRNLLDAVVRIDVSEVTFQGGSRQLVRGVGSGVLVSEEGHVLTNAHVVSPQAETIEVTLASLERVSARLIGWDHWTDLALIQLDMAEVAERGLGFAVAEFGSSDDLYPGQTVFAVGTPHGLTRTVTKGIISNPSRYFAASNQIRGYETGYFNTWLQMDAAINPGNSGGPLVTAAGEVVGINTRSYLGANNLSFAVPSKIALEVLPALQSEGAVARSYLGLSLAPMQDLESFYGLEANRGVLIQSVDPGSPAEQASIRPGDILLELDGEVIDGRFPEQLPPILHRIASHPIGDEVELTIRRNNEPRKITLETERLESRMGRQWAFEDWGLSVQEVSKAYARERQIEDDDGLLVIGVQNAFPAYEAGLAPGDIILSVNRDPVQNLDDLKTNYTNFEEQPERVLFEVNRDHQISYFVVKPQ